MPGGSDGETRLLVRQYGLDVKVGMSPLTRGVVSEATQRTVMPAVEDIFDFAEMSIVTFEDLCGGKLDAALDGQHPRDLYDVKLLFQHEG
jgi:hypothetical protein